DDATPPPTRIPDYHYLRGNLGYRPLDQEAASVRFLEGARDSSRPRPGILQGDVREVLLGLPDESVHCIVTSPPYWGLRDYG
ncbi:hypothetical protein B1B_05232, partial [mine drainage metagenome]